MSDFKLLIFYEDMFSIDINEKFIVFYEKETLKIRI